MFGFLKKLLHISPANPAQDQYSQTTEGDSDQSPEPPPLPKRRSAAPPGGTSRTPATQQPALHQNGRGVEVPLQRIIECLPLELQPRVRQSDVGEMTISIPLEKILAQLSRGAVKVSFGELRQAAPDVFSAENDRDRVLVPLPLSEILSRINPALITRRRAQRQIEIPSEISSPFENEAQDLTICTPSSPRHEPAPKPLPASPRQQSTPTSARQPSMVTPVNMGRANQSPVSASPPPVAMSPINPATSPRLAIKPASASAPPMAPAPTIAVRPAGASNNTQSVRRPTPAPAAPVETAPAPALVPMPASGKPGIGLDPVLLPLAAVAESWPEAIRKEIVDLNIVDAKLAVPGNAVEQALKQGRIAFSWKSLRGWVKPAIQPSASAHDGTVLELPLKVVAPIFLARQQEAAKAKLRVAVDEDIPNLFFGFPQPEPAIPVAVATAKPADTNYYVWDDSNDSVKVQESDTKSSPSPGTKFATKFATPNEIVARAAVLDGVTGALIALPDGLMVANRLPADVNADTLAAFLPQIFGKVSQCTKELRMGDLNNLNFTVGNVPWKIFRVNAIFFAAFGRVGEPLPTAQLAALAAELDHKPK